MGDSLKPQNVIQLLLKQSDAYDTIERIEMLLEDLDNLKPLPVQPLYVALKTQEPQAVAKLLPRMSRGQRQAFLDIDLWKKDEVDIEAYPFWLQAYLACPDEAVRSEFVQGSDFLIYLKSALNVWTFDAEDPQYPDHDNYFLTEDSLLLFEFHEDFAYVEEVRQLIRELYSQLGVEKAYDKLLVMITESFSLIEETAYQSRISRLRDYGILDYFDALELVHPLASTGHIDQYLMKKREAFTPKLDDISLNETLHQSALIAYREKMDRLSAELAKVASTQRVNYLHFNFLRLVNASLSAQNALKEGRVALTRIGQKTRGALLLGYDYTMHFLQKAENRDLVPHGGSLFDRYDFVDLYKVGQSLLQNRLKQLKKNLHSYRFEGEGENFLGKYWVDFLDESFADTPRVCLDDLRPQVIDRLDLYQVWADRAEVFLEFLPFIAKFRETFEQLALEGRLQDHFYLNYQVADIDFEAILLSSFANHLIGSYDKEKNPGGSPKMGLTIEEFKKFTVMILTKQGTVLPEQQLSSHIDSFRKQFGFFGVKGFGAYLRSVLTMQLEGYDYENLAIEDYRHVGGPILLSLN